MDEWLTEEVYFHKNVTNYSETNVVANPRYCPPYLYKLEFIKLICVFRGKCSFYYRGTWTELNAGNICIVAPGVEQTVFSGSDEDVVVNYLMRRSTFNDSFPELLEIRDTGLIAEFFCVKNLRMSVLRKAVHTAGRSRSPARPPAPPDRFP